MKSFREHIKEEVLPTVQVADGGLDIEKPAVRAAINAAIAGVVSQPAVTPYVVFNRLSKLLAQYHIVLPKRFLEGDRGVEVFEVKQFGHKMGMTDGGEFVSQVPTTHYLFLQYGIITPFGITYAKPVVGGMFRVMARLVDKDELDKLLDMAEIALKEEAECRQMAAKAMAPKEPMHDITSDDKKKGNKAAVADSEKGLKEGRMPASVIKHKQKLANMTPEEKAKKFAGKSKEELQSMARRHGYGKDSNEYSKHLTKEEKGDRLTPQTMNNPTGVDKTGASERDRGITFVPKNPKGNDSDMPQNTLKPEGKFTNRVDPEGRKNEYAPGGTMYESAPPGRERQVKALKKKFPKGSGSPFAIAWSSYNKSHQKEETKFDPSTEIPKNT